MTSFFEEVYEAVNKTTNTEIIINYLNEKQYKRNELIVHICHLEPYKKNLKLEIYQYLIIAKIKQQYTSYDQVLMPRFILSDEDINKFYGEINMKVMIKLSRIICRSVTNINVKYMIKSYKAFFTKVGKNNIIAHFVNMYINLYNDKRVSAEFLFFEKIYKDDSNLVYRYTKEINEIDCPICFNKSKEYHKYSCNHFVCKECSFQLILNYQKDSTKHIQCPYCREHITIIKHN